MPDALAADAVATEASVTVARCTENYVRAGGCPNCPGQLGELCSIDESRCECFAGTGLASPSVWICAGPGAWTNADACPATPPSLGDACSTPASCRYLVGGRVAVARCFEGRWGPQPYTCGP